jgi:hypothetical protein
LRHAAEYSPIRAFVKTQISELEDGHREGGGAKSAVTKLK